MRIAIVSDIHGNRSALEAGMDDIRKVSTDLILYGGDLAGRDANSADVVDQIRNLGWPGEAGHTLGAHGKLIIV